MSGYWGAENLRSAFLERRTHERCASMQPKSAIVTPSELWPVYAKSEELNVPIVVHTVNTGPIAGGMALNAPLQDPGLPLLERHGKSDRILANIGVSFVHAPSGTAVGFCCGHAPGRRSKPGCIPYGPMTGWSTTISNRSQFLPPHQL